MVACSIPITLAAMLVVKGTEDLYSQHPAELSQHPPYPDRGTSD